MEAKFSWLKFPWLDFKRYSIKRISNLVWKRFYASHYLLHHTIHASRQKNIPVSSRRIHFVNIHDYKLTYHISQKIEPIQVLPIVSTSRLYFRKQTCTWGHRTVDILHVTLYALQQSKKTEYTYTWGKPLYKHWNDNRNKDFNVNPEIYRKLFLLLITCAGD